MTRASDRMVGMIASRRHAGTDTERRPCIACSSQRMPEDAHTYTNVHTNQNPQSHSLHVYAYIYILHSIRAYLVLKPRLCESS